MPTVAVAWVPEGIAVVVDTRATNIDTFDLKDDYAVKILPFKKYRMFITLCGYSNLEGEQFQDFMQRMVDENFTENTL